jgi:hypothetical protein
MKFKGTWIFAIVVLLVAGYAYHDYQQNQAHEENKASENHAYKGQSSENIKTFLMHNKEGEFQLTNLNGHWSLTAPIKDGIDRQALEDFLSGLFAEDLKPFESDTPKDQLKPEQFGFDKPLAHIEMEFNDGKKSTLDFGSVRAYDESYYVRKDGGNIVLGGAGWSAYLNKAANDLRNKDLYPNGKGEVTSFAVKSKGVAPYKFTLNEGRWSLEKQPNFKVDDAAITEYLNRIHHLSADRIVSEEKSPGDLRKNALLPEQADTALTFTFENAPSASQADGKATIETWTLTIAPTKTDKTVIESSSTKPIYEVSKAKLVGVSPDVSTFRNKIYPFQFDPAMAHQVRLVKESKQYEMRYTKLKGTWEIDVENPHEVLDPVKLEGLMESLRNLSATKYFGRGKWNDKAIKENRIQILDDSEREVFVIEWGSNYRENEQDFYLVKTNLADEVMSVPKTTLDEIDHRKLLKDEPAVPSTIPGAKAPGATTKGDKK